MLSEGKPYWKYNIFLVDNDALQQDVWISNEQIFDQTSGKNQFLQAAKVWVEPNISYNFNLIRHPLSNKTIAKYWILLALFSYHGYHLVQYFANLSLYHYG